MESINGSDMRAIKWRICAVTKSSSLSQFPSKNNVP